MGAVDEAVIMQRDCGRSWERALKIGGSWWARLGADGVGSVENLAYEGGGSRSGFLESGLRVRIAVGASSFAVNGCWITS